MQTERTFRDTLVGDVYELIVKRPSTIARGAKISTVIEGMLDNPVSRKVYVIDDEGRLLGMVNTETILRLMGYRVGIREAGTLSFYRFLRDVLKDDVSTLMTSTRSVTREHRLVEALEIMVHDHVNDLPVVDPEGRIIGELVSLELFVKGKGLFRVEPSESINPGSP